MINVILKFLELDLVNINESAKFYQHIPNGLRVKFHCFQNLNFGKTSTNPKCHETISWATSFSLFQNLNLGNASATPKLHLTISWATSCQYHCVCKILSKYSKRFKSYRHFSQTGGRQNLHKQDGDKNQMFDYRALLEIQLSVDFLRVVQCICISIKRQIWCIIYYFILWQSCRFEESGSGGSETIRPSASRTKNRPPNMRETKG